MRVVRNRFHRFFLIVREVHLDYVVTILNDYDFIVCVKNEKTLDFLEKVIDLKNRLRVEKYSVVSGDIIVYVSGNKFYVIEVIEKLK